MSKNVDQCGKLEETPFSYRISKDGTVFLEYRSRVVKTLRDRAAQTFLERIEALEPFDVQLVLTKLTGNFRHDNERHHSPNRNWLRISNMSCNRFS